MRTDKNYKHWCVVTWPHLESEVNTMYHTDSYFGFAVRVQNVRDHECRYCTV